MNKNKDLSYIDELRKSQENEIYICDVFLDSAKEINKIVPYVIDRKHEAEVKLFSTNHIPEAILVNFSDILLTKQKNDEMTLANILPAIPPIPPIPPGSEFRINTTGGTLSYQEVIANTLSSDSEYPRWSKPIIDQFDILSEQKLRISFITEYIGKLYPELSSLFSLANDSAKKTNEKVYEIDIASIRMRDVIEQIWGNLLFCAKKNMPESMKPKYFEFKKENDRNQISHYLVPAHKVEEVNGYLDSLYILFRRLSPEAKKPLSNMYYELKLLHSEWIFQIFILLRCLFIE